MKVLHRSACAEVALPCFGCVRLYLPALFVEASQITKLNIQASLCRDSEIQQYGTVCSRFFLVCSFRALCKLFSISQADKKEQDVLTVIAAYQTLQH